VCRQSKLGSVSIALAKVETGLDDAQLQSVMHRLRHQWTGRAGGDPSPLRDVDRQAVLGELAAQVRAHPRLSETRKQTLLGKVESVLTPEDLADDLVYATSLVRFAAAGNAHRLRTRLRDHAAAIGQPVAPVVERFTALRAQAPGGRQRRATPLEKVELAGLPADPATRHALAVLAADPAPAPPPPVVVRPQPVSRYGVNAAGYDGQSGRAEVHLTDGRQWRFGRVPADLGSDLVGVVPEVRDAALGQLLRDPIHHQNSQPTPGGAGSPGTAEHCPDCGQWVGEQSHRCRPGTGPAPGDPGAGRPGVDSSDPDAAPVVGVAPGTPLTVLTGRGGWLVGPDPDPAVAALAGHGELSVEVHGELTAVPPALPGAPLPPWWAQYPDDGQLSRLGFVSGRAHLRPGPTAVAPPAVDPAGLACSCYADHPEDDPQKRCSHITAATAILAEGYRPRPATGRMWDQRITDPAAGQSSPAAATSVEQLTGRWWAPDISTVHYATDPASFAADLRMVNDYATEHPADPVPLLAHDAVYGFGQGRTFGVELEFTDDEDDDRGYDGEDGEDDGEDYGGGRSGLTADAVAARLHRGGLTTLRGAVPYHSSASTGWQQWAVELDSTVAGEVVSPPLEDRPDVWADLSAACTAIWVDAGEQQGGGGSHVHVDATGYGANPVAAAQLIRLSRRYTDELHQLATVPDSQRDRDYGSYPHQVAPVRADEAWLSRLRAARHRTINFGHVQTTTDTAPGQSRLEFRLWDSSAQPGRVQAQIKISLAMAAFALAPRHPRRGSRRRTCPRQRQRAAPGPAAHPSRSRLPRPRGQRLGRPDLAGPADDRPAVPPRHRQAADPGRLGERNPRPDRTVTAPRATRAGAGRRRPNGAAVSGVLQRELRTGGGAAD